MITAHTFANFSLDSTVVLYIFTTVVFFSIIFGKAEYSMLCYVAIIFLFTTTMIGLEDPIIPVYARGTGKLPLGMPILNVLLIFLFCFFFVLKFFRRRPGKDVVSLNVTVPSLLFVSYIIIYMFYGLFSSFPVADGFRVKYGVINLINAMILLYTLVWAINTRINLNRLKHTLLFLMFFVGIYGIIRYLFFGGDPANFYMNVEKINVQLTFVDIGHSVLFSVCLCYSALQLLNSQQKAGSHKLFFMILFFISVFNILFSFRRTAWFGLIIIALWLLLIVQTKKKPIVIVILIVGFLFGTGYVVKQRFTGKGYRAQTLTSDIQRHGEVSFEKGRFSELGVAFETFKENPVFGVGPWSPYTARSIGHFAFFTHSTIVHMLFKTGAVGFLLFIFFFGSYIVWWLKKRKGSWLDNDLKILGDACFAGFLFELPDICFGTPIIIYRHMQIIGFLMATTYLSYYLRTNEIVPNNKQPL
jgi:O-antigen ligase